MVLSPIESNKSPAFLNSLEAPSYSFISFNKTAKLKCDSYSRDAKGRIPLHYCIKSNHLDVFKYFISIGFDINIRDNKGRTPLHLSIKFRSREIKLHLLFNNSCKKCIPDNNGKTPLQYAIDANDTEATDILLYGVILPIIFKIT